MGENWSKNTVELAKAVGIFNNYPTDVSAAVRRGRRMPFQQQCAARQSCGVLSDRWQRRDYAVMSTKTLLDTTFPPADPQDTQTVTPKQDGAVPASPAASQPTASEPEQPPAQ